jgi:hypothetical protein
MAILRNAIICPDGTEIVSRHRHDFVCHDGYCVDGGNDYLRRLFPEHNNYKENSLTTEDGFERIRNEFEWGTRGVDGNEPLRYVKLKDVDDAHIQAILDTQSLRKEIKDIFIKEIEWRG